jgi:hypothetical protein
MSVQKHKQGKESKMHPIVGKTCGFLCFLATATFLSAQTTPTPDVLILKDSEKLIGHLKSADSKTVVFKSDLAGLVTIPWASIQELRSDGKFAAVPKNVSFRRASDAAKVPQGTLEMKDQKVEVTSAAPAPPTIIPVDNISNVVDQASFEHALRHQKLLDGWSGGVNFGIALSEATTSSTNETAAFNLSRTDPSEDWLQPRDRTTVSFFQLFNQTRQDQTPNINVSIVKADLVHDKYFSSRVFGFVGATFEHTSPQGLDLLQAYGGGVGMDLVKTESASFQVRAGIGYMHQSFEDPSYNLNIIGSRFGESYSKTFKNGIAFTEDAGVRPAWNHMRALFAGGSASLSIPVYRRLAANIGAVETFLNSPPPGFKKNSFQLTVGAHYTFR